MALFSPIQVGRSQLSHRLAMAPLTRYRASDDHVHGDLAAEYYSQRASVPGTLLVTEATFISPKASGYANVPMIYNAEQIAGWKKVTDAVHAKGSFIYCQLWALGRVAKPEILQKLGVDLLSSSAVPLDDHQTPREMTEDEIWDFVGQYAQAAKNAIEAGFDGVEIHGANGYLIDQFIQDNVNKRTDIWGGSIENRSRFVLEVTKAVVAAVGADRVGIRLSPFSPFQGMLMQDPVPQFSHVITGLKELKLAYLHIVESRVSGHADRETTHSVNFVLNIWDNTSPVLLAGGFKPDSARRAVEEEYKDKKIIIVFGRYFISNPDLPFRVQKGISFEPYNRDLFYTPKSPRGYIDYPFSNEFEASSRL